MAKILILIGGHLCTAPRPQKEAETLATAGHDVTVAGCWFDPVLIERDRLLLQGKPWQFQPILDFRPGYRFRNRWIRLQGRIARAQYQRWKRFSPNLLGYGASAMLTLARQRRADLTIVHSEAGLWVGSKLLDAGYRVGVDFEDWFSADLLPDAHVTRPIDQLKVLEARLLHECKYCLTPSQAMATAMAKTYHAPEPTVIYNCFPWAERNHLDGQFQDRQNLTIPSLHWFSQTIGPGRGLETLFQALPYLTVPVEIHLRGHCPANYREWLEASVPNEWRDRLFIHATVPNTELLSRIAEHDIGLAMEDATIPSRNLTITNKLFQYLQAGLAVIATNTTGQQEIVAKFPGVGRLIPDKNSEALAHALNELVTQPTTLATAKAQALDAAQHYSWEQQCHRLLASANLALGYG